MAKNRAHISQQNHTAFTIVELVVVIAVIGILATIATVSFTAHQRGVRDKQRAAQAVVLAESLEKYYETHGEYPPCSSVTGSASAVTGELGGLRGTEASVLVTPKAASGIGNSIQCADLTNAAGVDFFGYVGDGTNNCTVATTGGACLRFTLKYIEEASSSVKQISSRHTTNIATSGKVVASATNISFRTLTLNWTAVPNASGYVVQRSTSASFSSPTTATIGGVTTSVTSLTPGQQYYFRVAAINNGNQGDWSNTVSPKMLALGVPVVTAAASSPTQINLTWPAAANAASYTIQRATDSTFAAATTTNGVTGTAHSATGLSPGTTYYYRMRAVNGAEVGAWSSVVSATTVVPAPAPYVLNTATQAWNTVSGDSAAVCTYGTPEYAWTKDGTAWVSGATYKISPVATITWGQTVTITVQTRCLFNGSYSADTAASNTLTHTLNNPTAWGALISYRTAGWGGSCPAYTTSHSYNWGVYRDGGGSGGGWVAGNSNTTATTWADLGSVWGDGRVQVILTCNGPWGARATGLAWDRFGPGCFPTGYEKRICYP